MPGRLCFLGDADEVGRVERKGPIMTNLILCGGSGTRLWPLSRPERPKQFIPLIQGRSLFEETLRRNKSHCESFLLAVGEPLLDLALEQARGLGLEPEGGLVEPVGRNTAPAIALACLNLAPETVVLVSPSDHLILQPDHYAAALERAKELALEGFLTTFGLKPLHPETGYGYIEADGETVISFHEKPDAATAAAYLDAGRYWWNSGMFVFQAGVFLDELKRHAPEVWERCRSVRAVRGFLRPSRAEMEAIPSVAIDVAVMQRSRKVAMVPCDLGWSDLGGFESLFDTLGKEVDGNRVWGTGVRIQGGARNLVASAGGRNVTVMGVDDLLVVDTPDELLVAKRGTNLQKREAR
jgi:mannose-1-phosphate guanylyltransferase